ncbi:unnamed protein product [Calypogeia fissa]
MAPSSKATNCQDSKAIDNAWSNFRKHLKNEKHSDNYAKLRELPTRVARVKTALVKETIDHAKLIGVGVEIVQKLNDESREGSSLFNITPPVETPEYSEKSHFFKVRCSVCSRLHTDLCSSKGTLEHNLRTHLVSKDHLDAVDARQVSQDFVTRTGKRGRPKKVCPRDLEVHKHSIFRWFNSDGSGASSSDGKGMLDILDPGLSLLCWGYWKETCTWRGPAKQVKCILDDQTGGNRWDCEQHSGGIVYNPTTDSVVAIEGLFKHKLCYRLSALGGGFLDLTCSMCDSITKEDDFRGRVHREANSVVPRGERDTGAGRRIGYLTKTEIKGFVTNLNELHRKWRWLLAFQAQKVCALSTKKRKLEELLGVVADRKDLRTFLRNIVNGYRVGAFGGKEAIWDFMYDIARNLNRKSQGFRYNPRTKAIAQDFFQFEGRQVVHVFSKNLSAPSLKTLKRERAKMVPFRPGLRKETFREVGKILAATKQTLGITRDVPVIFAEDETRI